MLFDIHIHTKEYSTDSQLPLRKVLSLAKEIGLQGICITDHGTQVLKFRAESLSRESGLLVIVGEEYSCHEGHLLVFGAPPLKKSQMPLGEALKEIKSQGGVAIAAHPFRWDSPEMESAIRRHAAELDGIEVFNGGATTEENLRAYDFAADSGLPMLGGSDAHNVTRVGRFVTEFLSPIKNEEDFVRTIMKAKSSKRGLESISVVARKGEAFTSAYSNEKRMRDRLSPPPVNSIKEILNAPRNRSSV